MNSRKVKNLVIVVVILLVILIVFLFAKLIVKGTYSSADFIKNKVAKEQEKEKPKKKPIQSGTVEQHKEFNNEDVKNGMGTASKVYQDDNYQETQQKLLGNNYERYSKVLESIGKEYKGILSSLSSVDSISSGDKLRLSDIVDKPNLSGLDITAQDYVSFADSLTAIGFYGDTCVLCAYNFPNNAEKFLILIDFSEYEFPVSDSSESWCYKLGDTIDVTIFPKKTSVLKTYGEWQVLYTKG